MDLWYSGRELQLRFAPGERAGQTETKVET